LSNTVSTVKQVHRQHTPGLGPEELAPAEHRDLVAQHQQLCVLGRLAPRQQ
jgi:hypothetical protein